LIHLTHQPSGGHFASLEEPELLVKDILDFTRKIGARRRRQGEEPALEPSPASASSKPRQEL
jgi:hypothetical protein